MARFIGIRLLTSYLKMKKNLFILFAFLVASVQSFGQVTGFPFEIYVMNWRFGPESLAYFKAQNIVVTNMLTQGNIVSGNDKNKVDPAKVHKYLKSLFPDLNSSEKLVIDWETDVFRNLRGYPVTDSRYQAAEAEWRKLIGIIREERPQVKIGIYGMPFRSWTKDNVEKINPDRKYDALLSLLDFLTPSVYLLYADEQVGRARNMEYISYNLDVALDYGQRLGKPVYPFFWNRISPGNKKYGKELIPIEAFADYVKYISTYSHNGYKVSGIYWWEVLSKSFRLGNAQGVNGWLNGRVQDITSYDTLMVEYAEAVVKELKQKP